MPPLDQGSLALLSIVTGAAAIAGAGVTLARGRGLGFLRSTGLALASLGALELATALGMLRPAQGLLWRRAALAALALLVTSVIGLARALRQEARPGERRRALRTAQPWVAGAVLATACASPWTLRWRAAGVDGAAVGFGPIGLAVHAALLLGAVWALAQLESLLRSTREPLRYRLKFVLVGLGAACGYRIYELSQMLMVRSWRPELALPGTLASLVCLVLVGFGLARSQLRDISERVSLSPSIVLGSATFLAVGLYLLAAGLVAEVLSLSGLPAAAGLGSFVLFLACVGLVVLGVSRSARMELRALAARHLLRSRYDYRAKWLEVTQAFESSASVESILDRLLQLLARTFAASRISIWLRFDADQRYHAVRSANIEPVPEPLSATHPALVQLLETRAPVALDPARPAPQDAFLAYTRASLLVPIWAEGGLLAFVALSADQAQGEYGTDDLDLLRAIARHAEVLLSHARLAEERRAGAELEALYRFSAFCLHDLKNLTARLSLVAQNAARHGDDPAFRSAAMRTVTHTAEEMTSLLGRLSLRSREDRPREMLDLKELVAETLASLDPAWLRNLEEPSEALPRVSGVREQVQQVLLNLLLNARQAVQLARTSLLDAAPIRVILTHAEGKVVISVEDRGPGIPTEQLRTLLLPSRSTKPGGLGIGLFECRRLVEANGGRLSIENREGEGLIARVEFPAAGVPHESTTPALALSKEH